MERIKGRCRVVFFCLLCLLLIPFTTSATSLGAEGFMLTVFPQLKEYAPPIWSREGTRLTYYTASAIIPDGRDVYFRDEEGDWVDAQGNRYRKEEGHSASGHGLMQVNVVTRDEPTVLDIHLYSYLDLQGHLTSYNNRLSVVDTPVCAGDFWLPPSFLASLSEGTWGKLRIVRLPYSLGGDTFNAIRFHYKEGRTVFVYDLNSGLLLYYGSAGFGPLQDSYTQELDSFTSTHLSHVELLHTRTISWPWERSLPPEWIQEVNYLHYSGALTTIVPGSSPIPIGLDLEMHITERGSDWIRQRSLAHLDSPPGMPPSITEAFTVSGLVQLGGLWLPPQIMDGLSSGDVLDEDPITGVISRVSFKGPAEDGTLLVSIKEESKQGTFYNEFYYRQDNGLLVGWIHYQDSLNMVQELYLSYVD